jgi:hypothetical protein
VKSATRKKMRVASTFTGTAACAALFMPSAALATTQHNLNKQDRMHAARPDLKFNSGCEYGTGHWLHFAEVSPNRSLCYGWSQNNATTASFSQVAYCGGNNYGTFYGINSHGQNKSVSFHQGTTYGRAGKFYTSIIVINGYAGTDGCGRYR